MKPGNLDPGAKQEDASFAINSVSPEEQNESRVLALCAYQLRKRKSLPCHSFYHADHTRRGCPAAPRVSPSHEMSDGNQNVASGSWDLASR